MKLLFFTYDSKISGIYVVATLSLDGDYGLVNYKLSGDLKPITCDYRSIISSSIGNDC